ncbi:hypothetical protein BX283_0060 [Streptomyces sp. TLI_146]|nr:hypothetical protein BX283_0060 [Streptomyces sp. TLI_146]
MTSSRWGRIRQGAAAASMSLALITIVCGVIALAATGGVPAGWWPRTGQAFDPVPQPGRKDPCTLGVGAAFEPLGTAGAAGVGAGVAGLVGCQVGCLPGQGRG